MPEENQTAFENAVISWTAPEYLEHNRGIIWKIVMLTLFVLAVGLGFYYHAATFSLAILAFVTVYYLAHKGGSKSLEVKISDIGIKVGNKSYPYGRIKSFWILYEPPLISSLNFQVPGDVIGDISVQLGDLDPAKVREFLLGKIPEVEGKSISSSEILMRIFKL